MPHNERVIEIRNSGGKIIKTIQNKLFKAWGAVWFILFAMEIASNLPPSWSIFFNTDGSIYWTPVILHSLGFLMIGVGFLVAFFIITFILGYIYEKRWYVFFISLFGAFVIGDKIYHNPSLQKSLFVSAQINQSPELVTFIISCITASILLLIIITEWLRNKSHSSVTQSKTSWQPPAWAPTQAVNSSNSEGSSVAGMYSPRQPEYNFSDVQGMASLKAQLLSAVDDHQKAGKNGILLSGDPGNGKTFIAEALAGELKWGYMPITIADIESRWQGQSTEQLKAVFDSAAVNAPLVLFFDECDSVLRSRDNLMNGTNQEDLKKANTFLTGIVDIRRNKNIIVIAATNYLDQLDAAATRDGRFDFKVEVNCPDSEARLGLLRRFTKGFTFEDGVLDRLVNRWEGFSVARIRSIGEKITKNANSGHRSSVSMRDAMTALREIQGSMGGMVPEETPTLSDGELLFDPVQRERLLSLATRMENIDEVEKLGGQIPKGVLFYGPPGTGKTAVAKSLAKTSGWAFLATSGSELLNDNDAFSDLLKKARDLRPCIIFIDEADDVLADRTTNRYGPTTTNRILAEMDGVGQLHDVMFIATTNHPENLDEAVIRGGRFGEHYEFKLPEEHTVLKMVQEWIQEKKHTTPFHPEFTPETVSHILIGESPSNIKDYLQQAVNTGVGRILANKGENVTIEDLRSVMNN